MTNGTILKYLQGKLPEEDRRAFEKRMREDASFAREVEEEKEVQIAVDLIARYRKKEQVAAIAEQLEKSTPRVLPLARIAASIAIPLLLIVGYLFLDRTFSNEGILEQYAERYQKDFTEMSGSSTKTPLEMAINTYDEGNFERALSQFSALPDTENEYGLVQLFIGNCELELGRYNQAASTFSRIIRESESYEETARWYLALAHLGQHDEQKTKDVLNTIAPGQFNYTKSQQMLSRLNSPIRRLPGI